MLLLLALLLLALPSKALVSRTRINGKLSTARRAGVVSDDAVVYDGVLTGQSCKELSQYVRGKKPGFAVFDRQGGAKLGQVELLLDSILTGLSDDSRYVEWWTVTKWRSHELHRDVDEQQVFEQGVERHPRNGHVLYLYLDPLVSERGGSTVVLSEDKSRLWICPPSPGRLLRFNGTLLHGVPRPTLEYFFNAGAENLRLAPPLACLPSAMALGEDESLGGEGNRVVLLFNTWPDAPPAGSQSLASEELEAQHKQLWGKGLASLSSAWRSRPTAFVPEAVDLASPSSAGAAGASLDLLIPLPADRRRRDTYEAVLGLQCSPTAPEAMLIRPDLRSPHPPRVISVRPAKRARGGRDDDDE